MYQDQEGGSNGCYGRVQPAASEGSGSTRCCLDFVSQPSNVTLTLNTDGVSLFRLSSVDLLLIWLAVNELPPKIRYVCNLYYSLSPPPIKITVYRFLRKNLLLAGMWFGRSKPTMSTFLKPLMDQLSTQSLRGIHF